MKKLITVLFLLLFGTSVYAADVFRIGVEWDVKSGFNVLTTCSAPNGGTSCITNQTDLTWHITGFSGTLTVKPSNGDWQH